MLSEDKFEKQPLSLPNSGRQVLYTWGVKRKLKDNQTDKDGKLVVLYTQVIKMQHSYIEITQEKGYKVLLLTSIISHLIQKTRIRQ
jgi:molecular chaperone HtpG